jgi:quercetin dioxygenase-like cupin family protein
MRVTDPRSTSPSSSSPSVPALGPEARTAVGPPVGPSALAAAYVLQPGEGPAVWQVGTYWRVLADGQQTGGRQCVFEELCPRGLVAPPHVHPGEDEAFFVLEGRFVFTVEDTEHVAGPGAYVYLPPGVRHGFRVESDVGRVFNVLTPAGFEHGIVAHGTPAPVVALPPPGQGVEAVWRELLLPTRVPAPWDDPGQVVAGT